MLKSNHLKKVEKLIEVRVQAKRIVNLLEAIDESLLLWKRTDKLEEYWDYFWSSDPDFPNHVGTLKTGALLSYYVLQMFNDVYWFGAASLENKWKRLKKVEVLHRVVFPWNAKRQISRLQPVAHRNACEINTLITNRWKSWRRKGSVWTLEHAEFLLQELQSLECDMEDAWAGIEEATVPSESILSLGAVS